MIRFYSPQIESEAELTEVESAHCCRVLRLKVGDTVEVVDGKGSVFTCVITDANPRHTLLEVKAKMPEPLHWTPEITLAVAPTKNIDRMEWLAEKAVEIGVNRLVFLNCHNNVRRVVKRDRFEKILISAMKQSLKASLPEFMEMVPFSDFIKSNNSGMKYFGYCDEKIPKQDFAKCYNGVSNVTIMIGPEGDFTPEEVRSAIEAGYSPVTFGNTRLRTETAALYALCATHTLISH